MEIQAIKAKTSLYLKSIKKRWYLHLLLPLIFSAIFLKMALGTKVVYTATTTFLPTSDSPSSGVGSSISMLLGSVGGGGGGGGEGGYFIPLMMSKSISEQVVEDTIEWQGKKRLLADVIIENEPPLSFSTRMKVTIIKTLIAIFKPKPKLEAAGASDNGVNRSNIILGAKIAREKSEVITGQDPENMGVIFFSYTDFNPALIKIVADRYIKVITNYYKSQKTEKSRRNYEFYVRRTDSVKYVLDRNLRKGAKIEDEEKFKIFAQDVIPSREIEGQTELLNQMYAQLVSLREAALNDLMQETPVVQILDKPEMPFKEVKPDYFVYLMGGLILGFMLSIILSIWKLLKTDITDIIVKAIEAKDEDE